ncbi:MAG: hypothetical protein R3C14_17340 [Caldilineaceae bacterium]
MINELGRRALAAQSVRSKALAVLACVIKLFSNWAFAKSQIAWSVGNYEPHPNPPQLGEAPR